MKRDEIVEYIVMGIAFLMLFPVWIIAGYILAVLVGAV